jgi:hypothetical protein
MSSYRSRVFTSVEQLQVGILVILAAHGVILIQALTEAEPVGQEANDSGDGLDVSLTLILLSKCFPRTPGLAHASIVAVDHSDVLKSASHRSDDIG